MGGKGRRGGVEVGGQFRGGREGSGEGEGRPLLTSQTDRRVIKMSRPLQLCPGGAAAWPRMAMQGPPSSLQVVLLLVVV